jgi:hypothetical protein
VEFGKNWRQYGFEDEKEARSYIVWIARQFMQLSQEEQARDDVGFKNAQTPEQVLQRYPVDEFRADQDIKHGRVKRVRPEDFFEI